MSININACYISGLLSEAKEAHTRYEERFRIEGVEPPAHKWEDWYARYLVQRIKDREYNELFGDADVSVEGSCTVADSRPAASPSTRQAAEAWRDDYGVVHGKKKYLSVG